MEITRLGLLAMLCLGVHKSTSESLQREKRNWIIDSFVIDEGYDGKYPYSLGKIEVEKDITLFKIHGQGVDKEPLGVLEINESTGELFVHGPVDYETYQVLRLTFQAIDREKNVVDVQLGIYVRIQDANDFAPQFEHAIYETRVKESTIQGTTLMTVQAIDRDHSPWFKEINMRIVKVSPESQDLQFYLTHKFPNEFGTISFKGCLDYEKAKKYTIVVEANDNGKPKQLSGSCTVIIHIDDENNHHPEITDKTSQVKVKEDRENVLILRVPVIDRDTVNTPSWRSKFNIEGDTENNFKITTDNQTNEGLLYVNKGLDYEGVPIHNITISVENEVPFYVCRVMERHASGLWSVASSGSKGEAMVEKIAAPPPSSQRVTVIVEDVNEAPIFEVSDQHASVMESTPAGKYLKTFTAKDPDIRSNNKIEYKIEKDVANWVRVDSKTGKVTTTTVTDRESPFVNNSIYVATVLAVDDGKPPMTGTATLTIHIGDENDNAPYLATNAIDICQSDTVSKAPITANDRDEEPNAGPFDFKLLGDVEDRWRVDPNHGHTVNLLKENSVHSGHYLLMLEVSDLQGNMAIQNLSVTVCKCVDPTKPNCRIRKSGVSAAGGTAVGIAFLGLLLLAALLLLVLLFSCKKKKVSMTDDGSGHLMISNTEKPGNDCEVSFDSGSKWKQIQATSEVKTSAAKPTSTHIVANSEYTQLQRERQTFARGSSLRMSMGAAPSSRKRLHRLSSTMSYHGEWTENLRAQESLLNKMLHTLQSPVRELGDYQPYVYAEEGDPSGSPDLDAMTISEVCFDPNMDLDLKFSNLAAVCMPTQDVYSTKA